MLRCDPLFAPLLRPFDPAALETHAGSILGLWPNDAIAYLNPAWYQFAYENGGEPGVSTRWDLGATMTSAISTTLLPFYVAAMGACRRRQKPWEHSYECSSPDVFRQFRMKMYPLSPAGEVLIVHSLASERAHAESTGETRAKSADTYLNDFGLLDQCAHCRRFRHQKISNRWDWISEWVRNRPSTVSETLCQICRDYYYPG